MHAKKNIKQLYAIEKKERWFKRPLWFQRGASDGIQTRGLFLGKEALYQLSYTRMYIVRLQNYT
jgi:hypothetical protein